MRPVRHFDRARGAVLLAVIIITMILTALGLTFLRTSGVDAITSTDHVATIHSRSSMRAGISYACLLARDYDETGSSAMASRPYVAGKGIFWMMRIDITDQSGENSLGLADECAKLNINVAARSQLIKLPGITDSIADCIIDWRDGDDKPGQAGAESEHYLSLSEPRQCKNAPFESVEELLMVEGMTKEILYGNDTNRNGLVDDGEDADQTDFNKFGAIQNHV